LAVGWQFRVDEATSFAIGAGTGYPESLKGVLVSQQSDIVLIQGTHSTNFRLVLIDATVE